MKFVNKNKVIKKDAEMLSPTLAYIIGVVYGDGNCFLQKSGGWISLKVKDKDFALIFKDNLENWSGYKAKCYFYNEFYKIILYCKKAAEIILNFNLNEIQKCPKKIKWNFLRGIYDSDGGVIGQNLDNRKRAKRWIHFSNNNKNIIDLICSLFNEFGIKYSIKSRIHSGFNSKKLQYELVIYNLRGMFYFYKNIGFSIERKQKNLKEVINSYNYYSRSLFIKAKELHKDKGYIKVAKEINVPKGVVYGWLFKNNQKQILDMEV